VRESRLWFWHILAAIVILFLLGMHMGTMHLGAILSSIGFGSRDPVKSADVFHRSQQLIYMITYILLLGSALFHGLYGLRSMLFELTLSKGMEKAIGSVCAVAGIVLFIYGTYVAVRVYQMPHLLAIVKGGQP
jgi:succinate dehydrogenase / fumarate reductase membrane anchor subunit